MTSVALFLGGSFRHFLWQVVRELQSSVLPLLLPCPSSSVGVNHGKYILAPGAVSYSEEKLLQFFGQVGVLYHNCDIVVVCIYIFWLLLYCCISCFVVVVLYICCCSYTF